MKQLNIQVDDAVHQAAKDRAEERGMLLRRWIQDAITEKAERERPRVVKERTLEPIEE